MAYILDRIKAAIKAAADAEDDYSKIGYGDPTGSKIVLEGSGIYDRGKAWLSDRTSGELKGFLDLLLQDGIAKELERSPESFCTVQIMALGVSPDIKHNNGISYVSKHETGGIADYITVGLLNPYKDTKYGIFVSVEAGGVPYIPACTVISNYVFAISIFDTAGALADLNEKFLAINTKGELP